MLQLAKLLYTRGFHITFVNNEFNHRRHLRARGPGALDGAPGFRFAAIDDGLPPSDADATQDVPALCYSTMTTCLPHLLALLARVDADAGSPPVTCLVTDAVMSFGFDAAREFGVPVAALWTASACGFMGYRNYRNLIDWGLVPFKDAVQGLLLREEGAGPVPGDAAFQMPARNWRLHRGITLTHIQPRTCGPACLQHSFGPTRQPLVSYP